MLIDTTPYVISHNAEVFSIHNKTPYQKVIYLVRPRRTESLLQ